MWSKTKSILELDTETEGEQNSPSSKILALQVGDFDTQWVFDWQSLSKEDRKEVLLVLTDTSKLKLLHNAKYDLKFLSRERVTIYPVYDTMIAEAIIFCGEKPEEIIHEDKKYGSYTLFALVKRYCGVYLKKEVRGDINKYGFTEAVIDYAAEDVKYLSKIMKAQLEIIKRYTGKLDRFEDFKHYYEFLC